MALLCTPEVRDMPHKVILEDFYKNKQLREHAQRSRAVARALDAGADVLPNVQVVQGR